MRRVYECTTYDTATAACTEAVWVERGNWSEMSVADAALLLGAVMVCFAMSWGVKHLGRVAGPRG